MPQLLKNNVSGVLANELSAVATSMTLVDASSFPDPGSDYYLCTLAGLDSNGREDKWEIVRVTAKASNTMTITRAQEGTTNRLWPAASAVQMRLTAGSVATPDALATKQTLDADLTAIAALAGTSGLLKKTAANTWALDTTSYSTLALGASAGAALAASGAAGSATTAAKSDHVHPFPTAANVGAEPAITKSTGFAKWNGSAWSFDNSTYLTSSAIGSTVQAYAANLTSWAALAPSAKQDALVSGTNIKTVNSTSLLGAGDVSVEPTITKAEGYAKWTGAAWSFVNETYSLSTHNHSGTYQPVDADLTAIAALVGTTGLLKKTAADTWVLDTAAYQTAQSVTGLVKSSGTTRSAAVAGTDYATPTGIEVLTNKTLQAGVFTDGYTEETAVANTTTAYTVNLANGSVQFLTLTGNCTYTFPTPAAGKSFTLVQKQDATGSRTVTWPASVKWPGGTAPTITSTASKVDKFVFTAIDGSSWLGSVAGLNYTA